MRATWGDPGGLQRSAPLLPGRARRAARAGCLLLALLAVACGRRATGSSLAFAVTHIDDVEDMAGSGSGRGDAPEDLAAVNAARGAVEVNGIIFIPDRCDRVRAHLTEHAGVLRLGIHAQLSSGHDGDCASRGRMRVMQYTAMLSRLAPGAYRLQVINEYRGLRPGDPAKAQWPDRVAYDDTVDVR